MRQRLPCLLSILLAVPLVLGVARRNGGVTMTSEPQRPAVKTVSSVDIDRYLGDWYEIARYENRFERKCLADVKASYARKSDGRLRVVNTCRTSDGVSSAEGAARVVDQATRAKLKVRFAPAFLSFLPLVWGDYWIIGLDELYRWAVVGTPDRAYLWILSRTPALDDETYEQALAKVRENGFDPAKLLKTKQGG